MDEELRLWSLPSDTVRECFAAPPELEERLLAITDKVAPPGPKSPNLLGKLGPLLRHPVDAPAIRPGVPNRLDAIALMTSRFITPDRVSACWVLLRAWLDDLAPAHTVIPLAHTSLDNLDFDLVRTGVPTEVSIRHLWGRRLDIPLGGPGFSFGYMRHATVLTLLTSWREALDELEDATKAVVQPVLDFVATYPDDPDTPDLIAWWTGR